jgi:hypothetical protein
MLQNTVVEYSYSKREKWDLKTNPVSTKVNSLSLPYVEIILCDSMLCLPDPRGYDPIFRIHWGKGCLSTALPGRVGMFMAHILVQK